MFHRTCLTFFAAALSIAAFWGDIASAAVYLRADSPGGTDGQTFDGTSWSTAYKTLGDAYTALQGLPATLEDRTLYVAQGVYANVTTDNRIFTCIRIYGGYKGETDGDMTRDIDLYQTIFCGKFNKSGVPDAKWRHDEPNLDGFSVKQTTSANLVVTAAGRIELPAFTGAFDGWGSDGSATTETLQIAEGEGGVVSGIWFTGFGRNQQRGNCMAVGANVNSVTIEDCVFTANAPQGGCVTITSTASPSYVRRCRFTRNDVLYSSATALLSAGLSVEVSDCEFSGNGKSNTYSHSGLMTGAATVKRCTFTHNYYCTTSATISGGSGSSLIGGGTGTWCDCVITNNFCGTICGTTGRFTALLNFSTGSISDSLIANNRCNFKASDGFSYAMIGQEDNFDSYTLKQVYSGCLIASNILSCVEVAATSGSYAIGLFGGHANKNGRPYAPVIFGCTFDGNIVTTVPTEGVTATLSRGILYANTPSAGVTGTSCGFYATNCTFKAEYAEGVYDIAQYGTTSTRKAYISNCVFMQDGAEVHQNAIFAVSDVFAVTNCTIKNMLEDFYPADVDVTDGLYFDEIPFERVPYLFNGEDTGYGWLRPAAKTPGIRETADGSVRGAVDELTETAENGVTLTIRREPFVGGTVDIPVQAVTAGAAISPVTATPVAGGSFGGWINVADGTTYSTDNPLTIASLDDDLILTASFATRKTTITFDLSGAGTFVENGASRIECELSAGDTFPELPEYTVGDNNHIYRWDDMPTVVPNEDVTYAAHWVTKDLRIIYVTKEGAGAKNGTSWENAYDDISVAYVDAGHYRGEVWIGEGVYTQALPTVKCASVNVRGGFAGDEMSAAEADPAAHPTVISGGRTTFYFLTDTDGVAGAAEFTGLTFRDFQRSAIDFSTIDIGKVTVAKCRFENCNLGGSTSYAGAWVLGEPTFSDCFFSNCFRAVYSKSTVAATTVVERCVFVAISEGGVSAAAANNGRLVVRNCEFRDGVMTTASGYSSGCLLSVNGKNTSAEITDCIFENNQVKDLSKGCIGFFGETSGNAGEFVIQRCLFKNNVCMHSSWNNTDGYYNSQQFGTCVSLEAVGATALVRDCSFVGNVVTNFSGCGASCIVLRNTASKAVAVNCTFEANVAIARENLDRSGTWRSVGNAGTINAAASGIGLVNCTFVANTNRADTGGVVADIFARASTPCFVLNDILWNDDPDYAPFARTDSGALTVGRTVAKSYDETVPSAEMGPVLMEDPRLSTKSAIGPNGVPAYAISGSSCAARGGYPVWTSGAQLYVYDSDRDEDAKWLNVSTRAWVAEDKLPPDVSKAAPLAPDAWGQRRGFRRVAFGALNAPSPATFILVR